MTLGLRRFWTVQVLFLVPQCRPFFGEIFWNCQLHVRYKVKNGIVSFLTKLNWKEWNEFGKYWNESIYGWESVERVNLQVGITGTSLKRTQESDKFTGTSRFAGRNQWNEDWNESICGWEPVERV